MRCRIVNALVRRHLGQQKMKPHRKTWPCPDFLAEIGEFEFTGKPCELLAGLRASMIHRNVSSKKPGVFNAKACFANFRQLGFQPKLSNR